MKKLLKFILLICLLLLAAIALFPGKIIQKVVPLAGTKALGVPVALERADIALARGRMELRGFSIANPAGFSQSTAIKVGSIVVDLDPKSLLSDKIVVQEVIITAPEITYETGLDGSNIDKLLAGLKSGSGGGGGGAKEPAAAAQPAKPGKQVVIRYLAIRDAKINLALKGVGGAPIVVPLIEMKNVGEGSRLSLADMVRKVLGAVLQGAGNLGGQAIQLLGGVSSGTLKAGSEAVQGVAGGAQAVGGAAVEGTTKAAGAAIKGVEQAGSAVASGATNLLGGIKKLF